MLAGHGIMSSIIYLNKHVKILSSYKSSHGCHFNDLIIEIAHHSTYYSSFIVPTSKKYSVFLDPTGLIENDTDVVKKNITYDLEKLTFQYRFKSIHTNVYYMCNTYIWVLHHGVVNIIITACFNRRFIYFRFI